MSDIAKTAWFTVIYTVGVVMNKIVSIIMLPIYTRCLTPKDYGTLELLTITTDIFGTVVGLGLTSAVYKYYYKYDTERDRNMVISTVTMMLVFFYFIAASTGFLASDRLAALILEGGNESRYYFQLMFAIFFLQAFIEIPLTFIKARQKPYFFVLINAGKLLLQLSLNIYFVVIMKMQVLGVLYSSLISSVLFGAGLIIFTFRSVGFNFDKKFARTVFLFGLPFIITNTSSFLLTFSDRYFLKIYAGLAEVGIYSLGYKMGFILWSFAALPFFNIWGPQRFEIIEKPNALAINQQVFLFFNLIIVSIALLMSLFSLDLFRIMSEQSYWSAYKIVPMIMLAYIIQAWTDFANFGIFYKEKTIYMAYGTSVSALTIIIASFALIPKYTVYGAAISTIIAFIVRFMMVNYYSQKLYRLPVQWIKVSIMLVIACVITLVSYIFRLQDILLSILFNSALFLIFIVLILFSPVTTKKVRCELIRMIRNPIQSYRSGRISFES
jgi:O-antigen/teichoic acid export membrane protein